MKTIHQIISAVLLASCIFPACKNESSSRALLESITVSPASALLVPGDTVRLTANPVPADADNVHFTWSVVHTSIATVTDDGLVTAIDNGATSVQIKSGDIEASAKISVTPLTINVTPDRLNLLVGDSALLHATSSPANAGMAEKPFLWATDNAAVASVVNGRVKGLQTGSAHITVSGRTGNGTSKSVPVTVSNTYQNPVTTQRLPDPTVIRTDDGWFYLYATEAIPHIPIMRSRNLVNWEQRGTVFTNSTRPACASGSLWAPDINYINGQYVLYCCRNVGEGDLEWQSSILAVTAPTPEGPFTDQGCLIVGNDPRINVKHCIDPFYIEDGGKKYMTFGSFRGIYIVELADDGLSIKEGADMPVQIAGTAFEASYIYRRGNYYYLFCSWGSCCNNASSNYRTVVGRSTNLFGPYEVKNGNRMLDNAYVIVIQGNSAFAGPGHNAEIVTDDAGNDWILYHAYDIVVAPNERRLMLDKIIWSSDGWPSITGNTPSSQAEAPIFNQ
ncbi:MAG: family 43 glycosylhydrolase [Bacteroidales bacterium]|jgi:arabinan endo-1,5-alpha-L-arabinosidase|nr:family 43 glycosylhydrolase [Bacteroidales bacterium]